MATDPSRTALIDRQSVADILLLVTVPAALLAVFSLPLSVRESLAFRYTDPSLWTAVAAPFVHMTWDHLAVNLLAYALVAPTAYLLSVLSGRRRRFRVAFVSLVLACPGLLSYLNLAVARDGLGVGFSGVVMALYGYLPLALADYFESRFGLGPRRDAAPALFFVGLLVVAVLTLAAVVTNPVTVPVRGVNVAVTPVLIATLVGLVVATSLVVLLYVISIADHCDPRGTSTHGAAATGRQFEIGAVATLLFLAVPFTTFPLDPVTGDSVVNVYVHLLGYALGFIGPYATAVVGRAALRDAEWL